METSPLSDLIAEAQRWANGHPNQRSGELMQALADALNTETGKARVFEQRWEAALEVIQTTESERDRFYEGLYQVYVRLGEDTDGARNADELFRPMVGCDPAEWVPRLVAECRAEMDAEIAAGFRRTAVQEPSAAPTVRDHVRDLTGATDAELDELGGLQGEPSDAQAWAAAHAFAEAIKADTGRVVMVNVDHARAALRAAGGVE